MHNDVRRQKNRKTAEIIVTNYNLVFVRKNGILRKNEPTVETIPVESIKEYNGDIQVKQFGNSVEIFFADGEKTIGFQTKHDVRKFIDKILEVYTGKKKSARGADKVKNAIKLVDDTLGIDTVDAIKNVAQGGVVGAVFGVPFGGKKGKKASKGERVISGILGVAQGVAAAKNPSETSAVEAGKVDNIEEQIEMLTKLKTMLENGIITQEEFDSKKKQILGV